MHIKSIQQFSHSSRVNCYFPMEENGLAPFEGRSEFASRVKADWNCRLQISAFSLVSVFRITFSLSEVIPNASFFNVLSALAPGLGAPNFPRQNIGFFFNLNTLLVIFSLLLYSIIFVPITIFRKLLYCLLG